MPQILIGKHVVFGKVIRGFGDVVKKISEVPVDGKDRPQSLVVISNCGELELRKKPQGEYFITSGYHISQSIP